MSRIGWRVVAPAALVGAIGAFSLYSTLAPATRPVASTTAATAAAPATTIVLADCLPPAVLEGQVCVTHVEQTRYVTVPAAPAAPATATTTTTTPGQAAPLTTGAPRTTAAPSPSATPTSTHHDDDGGEHDD
jgi:hypothetical protein